MILEELVWFFTRLERLTGRPGWLTYYKLVGESKRDKGKMCKKRD